MFGRLVRDYSPGTELAARCSADDVKIVMTGVDPEQLRRRIEELRRTCEVVRPYPMTFSAGVAVVVGTADEALRDATRALQTAERNGRDQTHVLP